jgi:dCMP deaminase|tara:strand:- start:1312 stop:1800 length:489 start_codon:yes stop_codon:yes gene_type:complete
MSNSDEMTPKIKGELKNKVFLQNIINKNERLDWDTYFTALTLLASKRSSCSRLNVGCVIVKNNRVITTGYNGFLKGCPHKSKVVDGHEQFTIHAEQNALCDAADRGVSVSNGTAYITHFPCLNCFKLLIASGISKIKYFNDYKNSDLVNQMAIENNIRLIKL